MILNKEGIFAEFVFSNFDMNFNRLLRDQEFKHETINRGKKYVNDCLSNQGNASRKLLEFSTKINLEN